MIATLLIHNGKTYLIPVCPRCDSRMLPLDLESKIWKCPHCLKQDKIIDEDEE